MSLDRYRFVDAAEHPVMLLVDTDGNAELHGEQNVCRIRLAATLSILAGRLVAEELAEGCAPAADSPGWEQSDEPLLPHGGTLDREAQLWIDGTGHVWNLALPWQDNAGSTWQWYGSLDGQGAPLMRSNDWPEPQPLDALRFLRGPMSPVYRGGAV